MIIVIIIDIIMINITICDKYKYNCLPKTVSEQLSDNAFIKCFVNLDLIYNLSTDAFTVMHSAP